MRVFVSDSQNLVLHLLIVKFRRHRKWLQGVALFMLAVMPLCATAQRRTQSTLEFEEQEWNFGTIKEVDGPVAHTFRFINRGRDAVVIEKVAVSCGCTTPSYTREPIKAGQRGEITVQYNPRERSGAINETITVGSREGRNRNKLTIRGEVIPRPRTVEDDYPFLLADGLRISEHSLIFGQIEQGGVKSMVVKYVNTSDKAVRIGLTPPRNRPFVKVSAPETVAPGQRGEITVTYDLSRTTFYGRYTDRIELSINGREAEVPLSATFTAIDDPQAVAGREPQATLTPLFKNFGKVKRMDKPTVQIELKNEGAGPLVVRWVGSREFITSTLRAGTTVQPGRSVMFSVVLDLSEADSGVTTGVLTLITNDPVKPLRDVRFAATLP